MKNRTIISIFFIATLILISSCDTKPSVKEFLKDDIERLAIIHEIVNHKPYMIELMNEMMKNDGFRKMMMDSIINSSNMKVMHMDMMMNLCKEDSFMCKKMMGKTMEMCDADSTKCKMMMDSMSSRPNVMKSMKTMFGMNK
jgi:hypothetical protein